MPARPAHLDVARARSGEPREDRREAPRVGVGGIDLAQVLHAGGERERLAAGAGAQIEDLHAWLGAGDERGELRALVLHFHEALDIGGIGRERRRTPVGARRDPDANRRERRLCGSEIAKRGNRRLARDFKEVRAEVDRRPHGERPALVRRVRAETRLELRREPFRKIAQNMRRRVGQIRGGEARAFGFGELRRRVAFAGEQRRNSIDVEAAGLAQRAEHFGAGACFAHDPGGRAFLAQRVIDEARNRRAVAGAGEAVREAPVLHRIGRRAATRLDVGQHFDRGGDAGSGNHGVKKPFWRRKTGATPRRRRVSGETAAVYSSGIDSTLIHIKPVSCVARRRASSDLRAGHEAACASRLARNRLYKRRLHNVLPASRAVRLCAGSGRNFIESRSDKIIVKQSFLRRSSSAMASVCGFLRQRSNRIDMSCERPAAPQIGDGGEGHSSFPEARKKRVAFPVFARSTSFKLRDDPHLPISGEPMSKILRVVVSCVVLAGLAACAPPPPPPPVVAPPPAKPLDAKTQLENHM